MLYVSVSFCNTYVNETKYVDVRPELRPCAVLEQLV